MPLSIVLALAAMPLYAQAPKDDMRDGIELLQDGMRLFLRGLIDEIGPAFVQLQGRIIDLNAYYPPEV
ncbi:MAG: hypothetical protein ACC619_09015, partial [Paracoccaceae bacterium]